jgi:predicted AAA+ superfamily ATPase
MELSTYSEEQIIQRIRFENPWWQSKRIDEYYDRMKRRLYFNLFKPLVYNVSIKRAVVLMGPRRVGKTVMIFHTVQSLIDHGINPRKICYLSIETPIYNGIALEELFRLCRAAVGDDDPTGFFIFFDEIQYLKNWEVHLKSLVDSYHRTKFTVSGSAAAALKMRSNESGAGRFTDFLLPALTFYEFIHLKGFDNLIEDNSLFKVDVSIKLLNELFMEYINYGGYPEVIAFSEVKSDFGRYIRNDIVDKVLLRDLPSMYGISDVQELNRLFNVLAYNSGNEISLETLNQASHVDKNTIKKYLDYLEVAFLIRKLHRVDISSKRFKREVSFKVYLTNPSLRCALFSPIDFLNEDPMIGNMVETAFFAQYDDYTSSTMRYARWKDGEVDFIELDEQQKPAQAIEVKWTNRYFHHVAELKSLQAYARKNKTLIHYWVTTIDKAGKKEIGDFNIAYIPTAYAAYLAGKEAVEFKKEEINDMIKIADNQ